MQVYVPVFLQWLYMDGMGAWSFSRIENSPNLRSRFFNLLQWDLVTANIHVNEWTVFFKLRIWQLRNRLTSINAFVSLNQNAKLRGGHHGPDRMVVGFTTTYAISAYRHYSYEFESRSGEMYSIHYLIRFVSDFRQVGGFLQVPWFHPPIKLTATI